MVSVAVVIDVSILMVIRVVALLVVLKIEQKLTEVMVVVVGFFKEGILNQKYVHKK